MYTTVEERFWVKADRSNGPTSCWIWQASKRGDGYGQFRLAGRTRSAHIIAWILTYGEDVPAGMELAHDCPGGDHKTCVNPTHVRPLTRREHAKETYAKGQTARGEQHGSHTHPEKLARGEQHYFAKLTANDIHRIRHIHARGGSIHAIPRREDNNQ